MEEKQKNLDNDEDNNNDDNDDKNDFKDVYAEDNFNFEGKNS